MYTANMFAFAMTLKPLAGALKADISQLDVIFLASTRRDDRPYNANEVVPFKVHIVKFNRATFFIP